MNLQRFKQVEDEYFRLKGLLAAGRMDRQQFEQELAQLIFEDEQGRRWMIGVDDAKWYVQDGPSWVQANPPSGPTSVAWSTGAPAPLPRQGSRFPVVLLVSIIVLGCICGALGIGLALSQGWLRIGSARPTTALILPTPFSMPTPYVLPTPYVIPTPFVAPLPPPTQPPVPTSPAPSSIPPTLAPSTTPTPTETPLPTLTPTATSSPTVAETPGLYVTAVRLNPGPKRGVDIGFYPMFLNTTGGTQNYRVKVYLYRPDNLRNSFGETSAGIIPIPVGPSEQSVPGSWRLSGGGGCEDFLVRVGWIDDVNRITFFNKPDGGMFEHLAAICP